MSFALLVSYEEDIPGMLPAGRWSRRREGGEMGGAQQGRVGTKMPPQTPKAAGAELWLVCSASPGSALLPLPVLAAPSPNWWAAKGPSWPRPPCREASRQRLPVLGMFPSLSLVTSPTHPREHPKGINWFIELSAADCRSRRCRAGEGPAEPQPRHPRPSPPSRRDLRWWSSFQRSPKAQTCSGQSPAGAGTTRPALQQYGRDQSVPTSRTGE